jgi:5-methylcytosine-specific restriction endonuclease McrA
MAKKVKKENKEIKERIKTKSQHLKELQTVFNKYIRLRDILLPCVSCGDRINGTPHASHFLSVGSHPALRFNENNCHSSCSQCNLHLHGNLVEYSLRLPDRIGQDNYDKLIASRGDRLQISIPEIEELKLYYKNKIKELL